jgi:hypothetical protein
MFTGWLEAVLPACSTAEERLFFQHFILDRISVNRPGQSYHYTPQSPHDSGVVIAECLGRLAHEGNLERWMTPEPLIDLQTRQLLEDCERLTRENEKLASENSLLRRSRGLAMTRAVRRLLGLPHL